MSSIVNKPRTVVASAPVAAVPNFTIQVIDPLNRTGKITVSSAHIAMTKGLQDHFDAENHGVVRRTVKDLSLCLLYLKGRCGADSHCNQIHVDAEFVANVRKQSATTSNCCARHGDANAHAFLASENTLVDIGGRRYALSQCARTDGLDGLLRQAGNSRATIIVAPSKICRLQQEHRCKFGKDCKYVHVCRSCGYFEGTNAAAAAVPTTSTVAPTQPPALPAFVAPAKAPSFSSSTSSSPAPLSAWAAPSSNASVASVTPPVTARHYVSEPHPDTELKSLRAGDDVEFDSFFGSTSMKMPGALDLSSLSMFVDDLSKAHLSPMFASPAVMLAPLF